MSGTDFPVGKEEINDTDLRRACVINEDQAYHSSPVRKVDAGTKAVLRKTCQQMRSFCNLSGGEGAGPVRGHGGAACSDVTVPIHPVKCSKEEAGEEDSPKTST